jgi:hypothetical protein
VGEDAVGMPARCSYILNPVHRDHGYHVKDLIDDSIGDEYILKVLDYW